MASLHDLKRRITSVQKTKKITQALNMVAASKFRKAQQAILSARPYEDRLKIMLCDIFKRSIKDVSHKYFAKRDSGKTLLVVVAADKGLCGGFNTTIIKKGLSWLNENKQKDVELYLLGNKVVRYYKKHVDQKINYSYEDVFDHMEYHNAVDYADEIVRLYFEQNIKEVVFIYNEFKSAIAQNVVIEQYLPVLEESINVCDAEPEKILSNYIYEPSQTAVLDKIVKHFLHYKVYRILTESYAAEQGARMTAMDSATENAKEVINTLELKYNRERQAKITSEIAEIIGGSIIN